MASRNSIIRVQFLADASQLDREMQRAGGTTETTRKKLGDFGKAAVAYLGVQALGAVKEFVSDSVRAFSDLEQSQGGTQAVFGESSKVIDDFAKRSAQAIGLSEAEFRTATTLIGGQLKRMTGDVDFAAEHAVILTQVGADLAATYGGTTKEAVEALSAAFRGEADPAERFNLNLKISEQNAKAVELGLAKTTNEVDDNARAQALLALIMEQSADAQGQFARELDTVAGKAQVAAAEAENMKAKVGEALVPLKELSTELGMVAAQAAGILATKFQNLVGSIDDVDSAIQQFEIHMGISADSTQAAITIAKEWGVSLLDLVDRLDLTKEELEILKENLDFAAEATGMTDEEVAQLAETLDRKLHHAQVVADEDAARAASAWLRQRDAAGEVETATEAATEALREHSNTVRAQVDPIFGLINANRDLTEAQDRVRTAVEEYGEGSPEHIEALQDQVRATADLEDAFVSMVESGIEPTRQNLRDLFQREFHLTQQEADTLIDKLNELDAVTIGDKTFTLNVDAPKIKFTQNGNTLVPTRSGYRRLAKGGITTGPTLAEIGEAGDEAVIPLNGRGVSILADALREALGTLDRRPAAMPAPQPTTVVHLTVNALDPQAAARAVVEALQTYNRNNGAIPIEIRSA